MDSVEERLAGARRDAADSSADAARRFAERAADLGLADVAFAVLDSPLGPLVTASTARGLVWVSYGKDSLEPALEGLGAAVSPRILELPSRLDRVRRQLDEYFEGRRRSFELEVDLRLVAGFRRRVLTATARIPYGAVATYRDMAARAGNAAAARAAGTALAHNPVPIVVPCHRVLRTGGGLGGYGGRLDRKRFLLDLEAAAAPGAP
jgi:methylated-DNA-[protein]-cysteine S-methyltransferase